MKSKRWLLLIGVLGGGAMCLGAFLIVNYQFGNIASALDRQQCSVAL
jgi:hypothetical protein